MKKNMYLLMLLILPLLGGCSSLPPQSPPDMRDVPIVPQDNSDDAQTIAAAKMISPLRY